MFKKVMKKQQPKVDNEKESKFGHKINLLSNENPDKEPLTVNTQHQPLHSKSGGKSNLQEILNILQRPMQFQIIANNQLASTNGANANSTNANNNKITVSRKGSSQIQQAPSSSQNPSQGILGQQGLNSQQNRNGNSQSIISIAENEIVAYVEQCVESGIKYVSSNLIKEAVIQLRNAEVLIDSYMAINGRVSTYLMLAVVINLGICFYKSGLFDEAYSCFENSDMRIKKEYSENDPDQWNFAESGEQLKKKRLRLSLNLQMCILFSEVGKHEDALDYSKKSSKLAIDIILESLCSCYAILILSNTQQFELTPTFNQKILERVQKQIAYLQANQNSKDKRKRSHSEYGQSNQGLSQAAAGQSAQTNNPNKYLQSKYICRTQESPSPVINKPRSSSTKNGQMLNSHINTQNLEPTIGIVRNLLEKAQLQFEQLHNNQEGSSTHIYTEEDAELAMKTLPVLHFVAQSFLSLQGKLGTRVESKLKIAQSLRTALEEILIAKSTHDTKRNVLKAILSSSQLDMYFIANSVKDQHWLLSSNILNLLQMKPLALQQITVPRTLSREINPDDTLRKIVEASICFYCISTETRFVEESSFTSNSPNSFKLSESEFWLGKSLEISYALIPQDAPMISQIINVFTRFHGIEKQIIVRLVFSQIYHLVLFLKPEDEEFAEQVKLLRPQKGVNITATAMNALKNNFFIPAIRTLIPQNGSLLERATDSEDNQKSSEGFFGESQKNTSRGGFSIKDEDPYEFFKEENKINKSESEGEDIPAPIKQMFPLSQQLENKIEIKGRDQITNLILPKPFQQSSKQNQLKQSNSCPQEEEQHQQLQPQLIQPKSCQLNLFQNIPHNQHQQQMVLSQESNKETQGMKKSQIKENPKVEQFKQEFERINKQKQYFSDHIPNFTNEIIQQVPKQIAKELEATQRKGEQQQQQFINQKKLQQSNFQQENNNSNLQSLSKDIKKPEERQQIFEKIEEIVKKQRPQSSSIHNQENDQINKIQQQNKQKVNNVLNVELNVTGGDVTQAITHIINPPQSKGTPYLAMQSLKTSNIKEMRDTFNGNSQQSNNLNGRPITASNSSENAANNQNPFISETHKNDKFISQSKKYQIQDNQSNQICLSEPSNSLRVDPRVKRTSLHDTSTLPSQAKHKKNTSYFIYQAASNANNQTCNNFSTNNTLNQSSSQSPQSVQPSNFLKNFNQYLKQNRLQDDKRQIEPHKPLALEEKNDLQISPTQKQGTPQEKSFKLKTQPSLSNEQERFLLQDTQNQQFQQKQKENSTLIDNIYLKKRSPKSINKVKQIDQHRVSLPDTFLTLQSAKNSGTNKYSLKIPQNSNQSKQSELNSLSSAQSTITQNGNIENIMPFRHQSEPLNVFPLNCFQSSFIKNLRTNSNEKESNPSKDKKLAAFKAGDITISTNFTDPQILNQGEFLKTLEINNTSLNKSSQQNKRTHSASHTKTTATSTKSATSSQPFTSPTSTLSFDNPPLLNNFTNLNSNQQYQFQASQIQQPSQQVQQQQQIAQLQKQPRQPIYQSANQQNQIENKLNQGIQYQPNQVQGTPYQFSNTQQNFLTITSNNSQKQPNNLFISSNTTNIHSNLNTLSNPIDARPNSSQRTSCRTGKQRKMIAANIQFSQFQDKLALSTLKSPTNSQIPSSSSTIQSPHFSLTVNSKLNYFSKNGQPPKTPPFPISANSQNVQRRESSSRKRRIKTDNDTSNVSSNNIPLESENPVRTSVERPKTNYNYSRLKTLI